METKTELMVECLAAADAVWLPIRSWTFPGPVNRQNARAAYPGEGVRLMPPGGTDADRKRRERSLAALAKADKLTLHRLGEKTTRARLTDAGEAEARRLCGLPSLYSSFETCREVARLSELPGEQRVYQDKWVSESPQLGDADERGLVETMLLPALLRQYVESNSDIRGLVYYALTDAGWGWTFGDAPPDDQADGEPEARALYHRCLLAAGHRLDSVPPGDKRDIGPLPLPTSHHNYPLPIVGTESPKPPKKGKAKRGRKRKS